MVESRLHGFLKKLGAAFLLNQGCFLVESEVPLTRFGQRRLHDLDGHHVIDVCGVGERFFSPKGRSTDGDLEECRYDLKLNILRGIEVKVSKSDFRNGFVCAGCNYNYLLTPMRLVPPSAVPKGVGLIEYNKYKFSATLNDEGAFGFKGLRVVKNPSFKGIKHYQLDNAIAHMARRKLAYDAEALLCDITEEQANLGYPLS